MTEIVDQMQARIAEWRNEIITLLRDRPDGWQKTVLILLAKTHRYEHAVLTFFIEAHVTLEDE